MIGTPYHLNIPTNIQGGTPSTEYDNLSTEELDKLLNAVTGRGQLRPTAPPPAKRIVNLDHILGGLYAE